MKILLNIAVDNAQVLVIDIAIIFILIMGIIKGWKQGFLESSVRFLGTILAIILAYILKNPVSSFMYTYFPFFKLGGIFKGVTTVNILVYDIIAFLIVFCILIAVIRFVSNVTGLLDRVLSMILLIGIPNKILGALVGFIQSLVILYFVLYGIKFSCGVIGYELQPSLADDVINLPFFKSTFGKTMDSLNEISVLSNNYKSLNSKDEYNYKALEILLKNNVISCENAKKLVEHKVDIENVEDLLNNCK